MSGDYNSGFDYGPQPSVANGIEPVADPSPDPDQKPLLKILAPFFFVNIAASLLVILWPLAVPVFLAEFCLLAIWSAWGPGDFWKRFSTCLLIGSLLFLTQAYLLVVVIAVADNLRIVVVMVQWLFSAWILAQIPLWILRYIWQWRITTAAGRDLERFSVNDNIIGITMIGIAFGSCRWATDTLIDEFGPFGFNKVLSFYGLALLEFYCLIALSGLATVLTFRNTLWSAKIIPLLVFGFLFAMMTAQLWFPPGERWYAIGIFWFGSIVFSWAVILPIVFLQHRGFDLYTFNTRA